MTDNKFYCGVGKPPKHKRLGTLKECTAKKQVRLYGLNKVDKRLVNYIIDQLKKNKLLELPPATLQGKLSPEKREFIKLEKERNTLFLNISSLRGIIAKLKRSKSLTEKEQLELEKTKKQLSGLLSKFKVIDAKYKVMQVEFGDDEEEEEVKEEDINKKRENFKELEKQKNMLYNKILKLNGIITKAPNTKLLSENDKINLKEIKKKYNTTVRQYNLIKNKYKEMENDFESESSEDDYNDIQYKKQQQNLEAEYQKKIGITASPKKVEKAKPITKIPKKNQESFRP